MIQLTKSGTATIQSVRTSANQAGITIWRQGAAWGFDVRGIIRSQVAYYFEGAWQDDSEAERYFTLLAMRSTRRGRKMLREAGIVDDEALRSAAVSGF